MAGNKHADAREIAIRLLARREHSALELGRKLEQRGLAQTEIENTLGLLRQQGLQSDERFAESYAYARSEKAYGPLRIAAELRQRGVDEGIIANVLDPDDAVWRQRLHLAYSRKFGDTTAENFQDMARRIRYLQYRGFELDRIQQYLKII